MPPVTWPAVITVPAVITGLTACNTPVTTNRLPAGTVSVNISPCSIQCPLLPSPAMRPATAKGMALPGACSGMGASSRVRFYQFFPYLEDRGMEITVSPLLTREYLEKLYAGKAIPWGRVAASYIKRMLGILKGDRFDLLWVEKELFPWLPAWFEKSLTSSGVPVVSDYDDAVFHNYDSGRPGPLKHKVK